MAGLVLSCRPGYTAAMRRFPIFTAPLALLLALSLVACGNKGPLVRAGDVEETDVEAVEDVEDTDEAEEAEGDVTEGDPVDDADADPVDVPPAAGSGPG